MSVVLPPIGLITGAIVGSVFANMAHLPEPASYAVTALGGVVGVACWYWSGLPTAWGFGASAGPGTKSPKWVDREAGKAIYEEGDQWRAVHYESGIDVVAEDPQDADDELCERLEKHGWGVEG